MSYKCVPSTRTRCKSPKIICNNLLATGYCTSGVFCNHKHLPELMIDFNSNFQSNNNYYSNLNLSPTDRSVFSSLFHSLSSNNLTPYSLAILPK